jgi:hypothetical protein
MATNNNIPTTELDYDAIKTNIKTFMKGQSIFADYDFDGSGLDVIMSMLAYNTHYNALYTNLAVNESFLDSASKRSSVVSRAKEIGYIPYSATAPTATVNITVTNPATTPVALEIPAYQTFSTTINGVTYSFYNTDAVMTNYNKNSSNYVFTNVKIKEGTPLNFSYKVADGVQYILPNMNIDLTSLQVRVQDNATSATFTSFNRSETILNLTSSSLVYFVKEIEGQYYQLEFGNDVIGKALANGNVVNMSYMTTNMTAANGANLFSYFGPTLAGGTVQVQTINAATGGTDIESIDSIRYNAPRAFTAQQRAVTTDDYKSVIYRNFTEAQAVNIWGGEDNVPPQYGKVFIAIKPKTTDTLTDTQKTTILNTILKQNNVVSITPEIVDPVYINVAVNTTVYYNPRLTNLTAIELASTVSQAIKDYNSSYLNSFTGTLKFSKLSTMIDNSEQSIQSNITTITLHREIQPRYNIISNYEVNLGNPIYCSGVPEQSILSTGFYVYGNSNVVYLEDLPLNKTQGVLRLFSKNTDGSKTYIENYGTSTSPTIDYANGIITIPNLYVTGIDISNTSANTTATGWELEIKPQSNDVVSVRDQLVTIPDNNITVNVLIDSVAVGDKAGGAGYTFTSSRN